jgi:hypothetical protein
MGDAQQPGGRKCFFCGRNAAEDAAFAVQLRSPDAEELRSVAIPRCGACRATYNRPRKWGVTGAIALAVIGLAGLPAIMVVKQWNPITQPITGYGPLRIGAAIAMLALLLSLGFLVGYFAGRACIRPAAAEDHQAAEYPAVKDLTKQGWARA